MKGKIITLLLLFVMLSLCFTACGSGRVLSFENTGYSGDGWDKAQGLGNDGEFLYYAGHHDKTNELSDIHKINIKTLEEVATFKKCAPNHGAEVAYYAKNDSLLVCSGGDGKFPFVYEMSKTDGSLLNYWDFQEVGLKSGALIAVNGEGNLILLTSKKDGAELAFDEIKLLEDGKFEILKSMLHSETDLGVPQGMEFYNGELYYLADAGISVNVNPHYVYKLNLFSEGEFVKEQFRLKLSEETEGLTATADGTFYFGSAKEKIYRITEKL